MQKVNQLILQLSKIVNYNNSKIQLVLLVLMNSSLDQENISIILFAYQALKLTLHRDFSTSN